MHNRLMDEFRKLEESGQESIQRIIEISPGLQGSSVMKWIRTMKVTSKMRAMMTNNEANDDEMSTETVEVDDSDDDIEGNVEI
jgi:predicted nucleotide-binding protein (sugar kinase/HSP70/actin superfamily)